MKILSLFSGIGAFEKALDRLHINYELVGYCENDKFASKSYAVIHGVSESMNFGDITKVDEQLLPKDIDLITYGFPCQDISIAGKQQGLFNDDGTQTRSGLFFEALRIIEATKPKIAIAENVKNLTSKRFEEQFEVVLSSLERAGYSNYWQVLNAKNFGIPQNRERVFIVSIRDDLDDGTFQFPMGFPLDLKLKDLLEDEVDEKFYLKGTGDFFIKHSFNHERKGYGFRFSPHIKENADIAKTITTRAGNRMTDNYVMDIEYDRSNFTFDSKNEDALKLMRGCGDGNTTPKILVREATKKGYAEAFEGDLINMEHPNSKTRQGRVGNQVAQTLTISPEQGVVDNLRIRKLTPKECFILMGFDDEDFEKAAEFNSNTQLYKQAGNSIVVNVLEYLFSSLKESVPVAFK